MGLKAIWKRSRLRKRWLGSYFFNDYRRIRRCFKNNGRSVKLLTPNHLWLDYVEVVVTTECNLRCPDCANLIQYYEKPYHINREVLLSSIRKLGECLDSCDHIKILGGEPFLNPDLKYVLEEIPEEKCKRITIATNGTVIPTDSALMDVMRRKRITVFISNYPCAQDQQRKLIEMLEQEGIRYGIERSTTWMDYGAPALSTPERTPKNLQRQFLNCHIICKSLLNGCLYYCPRSGHGYDLGLIDRRPGEYVDILHNTTAQNRREIRRLMWRHKPIEACKYCQRGTGALVRIPRGKSITPPEDGKA